MSQGVWKSRHVPIFAGPVTFLHVLILKYKKINLQILKEICRKLNNYREKYDWYVLTVMLKHNPYITKYKHPSSMANTDNLICCKLMLSTWSSKFICMWTLSATEFNIHIVALSYTYIPIRYFCLANSELHSLRTLQHSGLHTINH